MPKHSLHPGCIQVAYHSTFGRHVATLPTRAWNSLGGTRGAGGYTAWDDSNRDALDMIEDYANDLSLLLPTSAHIDNWIIFAEFDTDLDAPLLPVAAGNLDIDGQDASPGWIPAVQLTFSFFDTDFQPAKLVVLDAASNNDFSKVAYADLTSDQTQLPGGFAADTNAWSSRAGAQPKTPRFLTATLNRKLRKAYGLT